MKSFLQRVLLVSSLVVLATACGKDSKGNKSGGNNGYNPLSTNLNATSSQALANVTAWYQSTTEGNYGTPGYGQTFTQEKRQISVYAANGGCSTKPIVIFGANLGNFQSCSSSNSIESQSSQTNPVSPIPNGATKISNARLAAVFSGSLGSITNVTSQQGAYGALYTVTIVNQSTNQQVVFVIDTGINSVFNPVYKMDSATRTEEKLTNML